MGVRNGKGYPEHKKRLIARLHIVSRRDGKPKIKEERHPRAQKKGRKKVDREAEGGGLFLSGPWFGLGTEKKGGAANIMLEAADPSS